MADAILWVQPVRLLLMYHFTTSLPTGIVDHNGKIWVITINLAQGKGYPQSSDSFNNTLLFNWRSFTMSSRRPTDTYTRGTAILIPEELI
jgi:hypothetical protein